MLCGGMCGNYCKYLSLITPSGEAWGSGRSDWTRRTPPYVAVTPGMYDLAVASCFFFFFFIYHPRYLQVLQSTGTKVWFMCVIVTIFVYNSRQYTAMNGTRDTYIAVNQPFMYCRDGLWQFPPEIAQARGCRSNSTMAECFWSTTTSKRNESRQSLSGWRILYYRS